MSYTSGIYLLVGLPVLVLICAIVPQMLRRLAILGFSYLFFFTFSKYLIVYIFATTLWTYIIGRGLGYLTNRRKVLTKDLPREERKKITNHMKRQSRAVMIVGIGALLLVLLYLKYFNFFGEIINAIASKEMISAVSLMAPIGISFYTLQAISYMVDVYWEKTEAEKSLLKIAMFLCFFPQVMEGPIALYSDTAQQIYEAKKPTMDSVIDGTIRILWGLFKKLLVADRLNVVVAALFDHYQDYSGIMMLFAGIAYTAQLYCEFSG
ncbi:MAG: MBOAT family protein, partial [Lachnospiraceae bacterium]|nr:MBOAT family protein [Candidatus Equihabitans merdae]